MKKKLNRRIVAIILATVLTVAIILTAWGVTRLITRKKPLESLQAVAQNYGTIKLDCNYSETSHSLAVNQTTEYINRSTQTLYSVKFHLYANAFQKGAEYPAVAPSDIEQAYPNGFDAGYAKVTTPHITLGGDDNTVITVPLKEGLKAGDKIEIDLEGKISKYSTDMKQKYIVVEMIYDKQQDVIVYSNGVSRVVSYYASLFVVQPDNEFADVV
ncbi:MAG: hypothetical protein IJ295_00345, partial [Clostridia bacterium]|nr:hypothetical protein [Clostridia bacterium]